MKRYLRLVTKGGRIMTMKDHTEWFRRNRGEEGVNKFYETVIDSACAHRNAGSLENIKLLQRMADNIPVQTFVENGVNLLK